MSRAHGEKQSKAAEKKGLCPGHVKAPGKPEAEEKGLYTKKMDIDIAAGKCYTDGKEML